MNNNNFTNAVWHGGNGYAYSFKEVGHIIKDTPFVDIHVGTDSHIKDGTW